METLWERNQWPGLVHTFLADMACGGNFQLAPPPPITEEKHKLER